MGCLCCCFIFCISGMFLLEARRNQTSLFVFWNLLVVVVFVMKSLFYFQRNRILGEVLLFFLCLAL